MNKFILIIGCICMTNLATIRGHDIDELDMDTIGMTRYLVKGEQNKKITVENACIEIEEESHSHVSHESVEPHYDHDHNEAYCEQMKYMCRTFGKNKEFKEGDTLILYCGNATVGKGNMYKMIQFMDKDDNSKIETRVFGEKNGEYMRSKLVWKLNPTTKEVTVDVTEYLALDDEKDVSSQKTNNEEKQENLQKLLQKEAMTSFTSELFMELNGNNEKATT